MLMRFHFGLAVGHAYSHTESTPFVSTFDEVVQEANPTTGSEIPEISVSRPEQDPAPHSATHAHDGEEDSGEANITTGSEILAISASRPEQDLAPPLATHAHDGEEDALWDVDSVSEDEESLDLASEEGSEGDFDECRLDWDEELIAEEMYDD